MGEVARLFMHTFEFVDEKPIVDVVLQTIKENIFAEIPIQEANSHQCSVTIQQWMACYNLAGDPDDDPTNINIPESEGTREVEGSGISSDQFLKLLKIKKVNIGSLKNTKLANIGYYWDDEMVSKITDLLHEFQDLYPTNFSEMKGIVGYMGEMEIHLKLDVKLVKQRHYRLNPRDKEKGKSELDLLLDARIIETVEESEWMSPIVIQDKKTTGEVRICVDIRKLKDA